jgi:hypothetical protein
MASNSLPEESWVLVLGRKNGEAENEKYLKTLLPEQRA